MVAKRAGHTSRRTADVSSKSPPRHELLPAVGEVREFNVDDYVFYPAHGVGKVLFIEDIAIADQTIRVMGINFAEDQITLRLPVAKAASVGLRRLTDPAPDSGASPTTSAITVASLNSAPSLVPAARAQLEIFTELLQHGYSEDELFSLVIPKRTLARRRADQELLTVEETDKAMRLMRIATQAERIFGDRNKAHRWLRKPKRELSGQTPLIFLSSEAGARTIEEMLLRIEHGVFA